MTSATLEFIDLSLSDLAPWEQHPDRDERRESVDVIRVEALSWQPPVRLAACGHYSSKIPPARHRVRLKHIAKGNDATRDSM